MTSLPLAVHYPSLLTRADAPDLEPLNTHPFVGLRLLEPHTGLMDNLNVIRRWPPGKGIGLREDRVESARSRLIRVIVFIPFVFFCGTITHDAPGASSIATATATVLTKDEDDVAAYELTLYRLYFTYV
ncbi:hypothetical protein EI94DRAFT_1818088 [Lactarius quietus]|nr:hypothetical protein EI94DRAFT_1818088 [Lactarius quietus]